MTDATSNFRGESLDHVRHERKITQIGNLLSQINRQLPRLMDSYAEAYNLSSLALRAIQAMRSLGDHATLTQIGEIIDASPSTMTGIAVRLERAGFVERSISPIDRRVSILTFTREGERVQAEILADFERDLVSVTGELDDQAFEDTLVAFQQILDTILELQALKRGQGQEDPASDPPRPQR